MSSRACLPEILVLGSGFTGSRVAAILRNIGLSVKETHTATFNCTSPDAYDRLRALAPAGCRVLHSIPSLPDLADARILDALQDRAARVVYLSTTGVYGAAEFVDENTLPAPRGERETARVQTETAVQHGPWRSLILRPAAIYGPGRGVHVSMSQGRYTLMGDGSNFISRIHVADLAAVAAAALLSNLAGAFPVADLHPCSAREMAEYCANRFHLPMPVNESEANVPATRRNNRRVDGRAIFARLGVTIQFPTYREGLEAV
jgi:nucleoside-diphosphate-sugar epimerase